VYRYCDEEHSCKKSSIADTAAAGIAAVSNQHLCELTVTLGETADWMAVGHTRRILTSYPLRLREQDSSSAAKSGSGAGSHWVEAHYALHWAMLPVALGKVALPPLQVWAVLFVSAYCVVC
jgi:hypothetical protein